MISLIWKYYSDPVTVVPSRWIAPVERLVAFPTGVAGNQDVVYCPFVLDSELLPTKVGFFCIWLNVRQFIYKNKQDASNNTI